MPLDTADLDFDPDALREKYRQERDKRLRADANEQYIEVKGDFRHYIDDPYIEAPIDRAPLTDTVDVLVIGGGFGGLLAAARLREAGVEKIRILEKGGDFGGTWYWNRYPGAQCDIESYIYLPLLEETGYIPKEKYSFAQEIRDHSRRIGEHFDLYRDACFQTEIREITWIEAEKRWLITTNRFDAMKARYVVMSNGPLNRPKLPGLPGIERYKGHSFHTSRWDYGYTGGNSYGNLDKLADKKVAIIGTGATAIQCVPHLGKAAKQLYVFQRTPSSVDLRGNRPTDPDWAASLEPGWQKRRMENFNVLVSGGAQDEDLVSDGWTDIIRNLMSLAAVRGDKPMTMEELAQTMELADFRKMNQIRGRVEGTVSDAQTAEALKPWYRQFCKRPTFNDDYLPTFNRDNVTLVDTGGKGVERVTETGLVVDGVEYRKIDCIVFATRLPKVGTSYTPARRLRDRWPRWADPLRPLGQRAAYAARGDEPRLPQLLPHGRQPEHADAELPASAGRAGAPYRPRGRRGKPTPGDHGRTDRRGRSAVGADHRRHRSAEPRVPPGLHARLLQRRGPRWWRGRSLRRAYGPGPVSSSNCSASGARTGWKGCKIA